MLQVISEIELKRIKEQNNFFDFKDLNLKHGYCNRIYFDTPNEIVRYSDLKFGANTALYETRKDIIIEILKEVINLFNGQQGVVAKYNEKWIIDKEKSEYLWNSMWEQKISNKFSGGFLIKESMFMEKVTEAILKYNCFAIFIFDGCIIAPSDHMDIFIWFCDSTLRTRIKDIAQKYNDKMLELEDIH